MADAEDSTGIRVSPLPIYLLPLIFGIALLSALVVAVPMLPMGLEIPGSILAPLVLLTAALFAAISASWAGTLLAPDHTRTRLLPVVGVSIATAAVIALIVALGEVLVNPAMLRSPAIMAIIATLDIFILLVPLLIVLLSTSWATWHFRSPRGRMGREAKLTLALAIPVFFVGLIGPNLFRSLSWSLYEMFGHGHILVQWVVSIAGAVLIACGILGLTLSMWWRFRKLGDRLGMDAAITVGLVGLTPLIMITGTSYVLEFLGVLA